MAFDSGSLFNTNDSALRFYCILYFAYPIALVHRRFLFKTDPLLQHVYFTVTGLLLCYLNFGVQIYHSLLNIVVIYGVLSVNRSKWAILFAMVFNLTYLAVGYLCTATEEYDITWTTPHCVLTLRLTGWAFDLYDGTKKTEELSSDQKQTALPRMPSLVATLGLMYFPCATLVGPQFPMTRYMDLIEGKFADKVTGGPPQCLFHGAKRLFMGVFYTAVYHAITSYCYYFNDSFILSQEYGDLGLWAKILVIMVWAKITLYKYVACWLISEGSCVTIGLSYNGKDENGNDLWDACGNIKIRRYEAACTGQDVIAAFNINTNRWVANYVYKRLRFLNNRTISQVSALAYLAVWHGFHSGYYNCFAYEFVVVNFERDFGMLVEAVPTLRSIRDNAFLKPPIFVVRKLYCQFIIGYPLISFLLLKFSKWCAVYSSLYWCGHIFMYGWPLAFVLLRKMFIPRRRKAAEENGPFTSSGATDLAPVKSRSKED